ncbi:MAG: biotin--[acetyl-CoA-carboxylase] ligase [Dermatophilaceae bacterium]
MAPRIDAARLEAELARAPHRWTVEVHERLGSTNARAMRLARPWHVVVTEHQTQGRGRLQRTWETPAGVALTLSATVPLGASPGWLPLMAGLATAQALDAAAGVGVALKWPNDVLVPADADRKVCGILCEARQPVADEEPVAVLGIGVNVTQTRAQLPTDGATSVALAGGQVTREELLLVMLDRLARLHAALAAAGPAAEGVRTAYRQRCATVGSAVRVERPGGPDVVGVAVAVDEDGCLVVRDATGERAWAAGDVTHLRAKGADPPRIGMMHA